MTRKDCELIVDVLAYCEAHCDTEEETRIVAWVAEHIADAIKQGHPRFDWAWFMSMALPIETRTVAAKTAGVQR